MTPWQRQRAICLMLDAAMVLAFSCIIIAAGHGAGPVGLLLFMGSAEAWGLPMTVAWLGIGLLATSVLMPFRWPYVIQAGVGIICLFISWFLFVSRSEVPFASLFFSIPFLGVLISRSAKLVLTVLPREDD
jgi:hypothetical protein